MSRLRKNLNQPSVSLFPFLAVLICTLGVLIVMLVLAVKSAEVAKEEEQATQDKAVAAKIEEAKQRLALETFRSESIHGVRSDVLSRLADSRQKRGYLQQDLSNATQQLEAAQKQIELLKNSLANVDKATPDATAPLDTDDQEAAIEQLKQQIAAAKQALEVQRKKSKEQGPSRFSLVPHQGSGGTFRRPIFLECLKNEIRLQPLGITLSKQDFALPIQAGNPLDVALLTIQEHWQQLKVTGDHGSPYPLIVVRPDGAETFVLARRAMKSWTDEFGYELVDAEKELDFGEPDNLLVAKVDKVVQRSIDRQLQLAQLHYERQQHLSQFSSDRNRPGFSVTKRGGGSVTTSAYRASERGGRNASPIRSRPEYTGADAQQASYQANRRSQRTNQTSTNPYSAASSSQTDAQAFNKNAGNSNKFSSAGNVAGQNSPQPADQAASSQQSNSRSNSNVQNLAKRRGQGWALPSRPQGGTGYLRPITVVCSTNDLKIKTAAGRSYWKPQLRIKVQPGGEQRFEMLQQMLHNSGLVIQQEPKQ